MAEVEGESVTKELWDKVYPKLVESSLKVSYITINLTAPIQRLTNLSFTIGSVDAHNILKAKNVSRRLKSFVTKNNSWRY